MNNAQTMTAVFHAPRAPRACENRLGKNVHSSVSALTDVTDVTAVTAVTSMMAQTMLSDRSAAEARMAADEVLTTMLMDALKSIKDLTAIVTQQGIEIATLKKARTQEKITQDATLKELRRQVAEIAADVQTLKKIVELIKPAVRHYRLMVMSQTHPDSAGNLLDPFNQMLRPAYFVGETELDKWLDLKRPELWRIGWSGGAPD